MDSFDGFILFEAVEASLPGTLICSEGEIRLLRFFRRKLPASTAIHEFFHHQDVKQLFIEVIAALVHSMSDLWAGLAAIPVHAVGDFRAGLTAIPVHAVGNLRATFV